MDDALPEIVLVPDPDQGGTEGETLARWTDPARTGALALPVRPDSQSGTISSAPDGLGNRYGVDLAELTARVGATGAAGEAHVVSLPLAQAGEVPWAALPRRLVLLGLGDEGPADLRRAGAALARAGATSDQVLSSAPGAVGAEQLRAFVEGFLLASYRPPRAGQSDGPPRTSRLGLVGAGGAAALGAAIRASDATWTARRLGAVPSNVKSPAWLAGEMARLAGEVPGLRLVVHDEEWLAREGFGAVVAVGAGSARPPRLVVAEYRPLSSPAHGLHVALVGKGITFDTGGLSVKPREAMIPMKTDMAGAAAVFAAVLGAARAQLPVRVTAVLPLAENALGASSYRPGDVLLTIDGTTVEVLNTDAEGRLVLADALAWTASRLSPDVVVDVATLTGAATQGLGRHHAALYTDRDAIADGLLTAGAATGERVWRMPLVADYEAALTSAVADVANIATDPHVKGGSVVAALFLRRFAGGLPWAHLDIAGPARAGRNEHEVTEGPTGYGARLLLRWLEDLGPAGLSA